MLARVRVIVETYCIRNLVEDVELRNNIDESKNVNNNHYDVDIIYLVKGPSINDVTHGVGEGVYQNRDET